MRPCRMAVCALALALFAGACAGGTKAQSTQSRYGPIVDGSAARLASAVRSMRGRPVVVNYWATWCSPCRSEMPRFVAAAAKYRKLVRFLGVNVEDDRASARAFARRFRMPFRSLAMSRSEVQRTQDILGLPVTQFYRTDGELAFVHQGEIKADDLNEKINELVRVGKPVERPED